uniref:Alpha-S1-casein n=1 Tax=Callithrix jacchus TaxID=9483 RepID=F7HVD1_CALJA
MKLFILTCLVAVALARPKRPLRYLELLQKPSESSEPTPLELREEYINGMNRQRKVLREKQSDEIKNSRNESVENRIMAEPEQSESSTSSSSEEQFCRLNKYNQLQLQALHAQEQTHRMSENNHVQLPFQQLNQPAAYPYAVWYYPQIRQNLPFPPFSDIFSPIAPENYEKNNVMLW